MQAAAVSRSKQVKHKVSQAMEQPSNHPPRGEESSPTPERTRRAQARRAGPLVAEETEKQAAGESADRQEIPNKLYFRIGEVAKLAGIKPYVLRFWETEFPGLGPKKSGTGHRLYRRKDVELVLEIKRLLYEKRFTIEGARKLLESKPRKAESPAARKNKEQGILFVAQAEPSRAAIEDLRRELGSLVELLSHER
jgi:DNA-binding transcriptional MerR regulator